jgi:hypothetical protein
VTESSEIEVQVLLCDAAQELGGKLYILGGGWQQIFDLGQPLNMALAIRLMLPWHAANKRMKLQIGLVTDEGEPVLTPPPLDQQPIRIEGDMEVGRPPGIKHGSALALTLAVPAYGMQLSRGAYRWEVVVDGELLKSVPFDVVAPPPGFPIPQPPPQ